VIATRDYSVFGVSVLVHAELEHDMGFADFQKVTCEEKYLLDRN